MLQMIGEFEDAFQKEWFIPLATQGIADLSPSTNQAALCSLQHLMFNLSDDQLREFILTNRKTLLHFVFGSMFDALHKQSFSHFVDFLRIFFNLSASCNLTNDIFHKDIVSSLVEILGDSPESTLYDNFATYIMSNHYSFFKFNKAFQNFVIVLRKKSPADSNIFKITPAMNIFNPFQMIYNSNRPVVYNNGRGSLFEVLKRRETEIFKKRRELASSTEEQEAIKNKDLIAFFSEIKTIVDKQRKGDEIC